ncbi:Adaptive-response sensory-kinase SasA [Xanthomonas hydrangeae]|uniref:sensor histidine kinase n=1 Tax=Xanthomonas hydrangeae TaxID=2775159 RepID=UPI0019654DCB|nr:Adaptive-response sensory-kinase SasA [Xanthomonas hydrangeae]CAD7716595.1 Adaptive-response sensory-kinase SasA [Xanthomonas hydrangeae]CAD7732124.1 Adaptive-response sensory-kinase SasA [Xanthomonas hydrangeae]CAD7732127.1 Adaptive-response sensory-kinase SasA [Xanthomonas hydrangeae]CAD7735052.1 Adaptive-response sensory-kinase SasA [Xanthomonas hydrangeae]
MSGRRSLRRWMGVSLLSYILVLTVVISLHGYWVNEQAERLVWQSLLHSEMEYLSRRRAADPGYSWPDTDILRLYESRQRDSIPAAFARLPPGVHDEVKVGNREFVVLVQSTGAQGRQVLALDISAMEQTEWTLLSVMAGSVLVVVALLAAVALWGVGRLVAPLAALSAGIGKLRPDGAGENIHLGQSAPEEMALIADAVNAYSLRIKHNIDRERDFITTASHELRTPIAVFLASIEVLVAHPDISDALQPHLLRAQRTAQAMDELATMLLTLARDPQRILDNAQPVDLFVELACIVQNHAYLMIGKELAIQIEQPSPSPWVRAQPQILTATIGNLIRNAIENSDRGVIRIVYRESTLVIEDPGHGMSAREMSDIYSRIARTGDVTSGGIGIELIARICAHCGWVLEMESHLQRGTIAKLSFEGAIVGR